MEETKPQEERNYDFTSLSERISAQTEAYIEFSNALVKIIEQTASIRDNVKDVKELLNEEYKTLNSRYQDFLLEYTKHHTDDINHYNLLNKDMDLMRTSLNQLDAKFKLLGDETTESLDSLHNMSKTLNDTNKTLGTIFSEYHSTTSKHLETIVNHIKSVDRIKYFFLALMFLVSLYATLSSLNILKVTWFTH